MALSLLPPPIHRLSPCFRAPSIHTNSLLVLLGRWASEPPPAHTLFSSSSATTSSPSIRAHSTNQDGVSSEESSTNLLSDGLLRRLSGAKDADQVVEIVVESQGSNGLAIMETSDCNSIITAAFDRGNIELALSLFNAMRSSSARDGALTWARPDVGTYALLVQRLAASLRVSDAIRVIDYVSRVGVSSGEEVPFGMIIRCPTCLIAVAVAQPQHGTQVVSCSKCRYQYELFSGEIVSIDSEEIR